MLEENLVTPAIVKAFNEQIPELVEVANNFTVSSAEDVNKASDFLSTIKKMEKTIEDKRVELTGPINQSLKNINKMFKELSDPLKEAVGLVSGKIISWRYSEQKRIREEEAELMRVKAEALKNNDKELEEMVEEFIPEPIKNTMGKAQTRKITKWRLIAFSELSDAYKTTNDVYINQKVREGIKEIKGLEIYQEEILAITR